jgi:hypothetical protein
MQDADVANGNQFRATGREILLVLNSGASPTTFVIDSVPDPYRRERDVNENIPAGEMRLYGPFSLEAWRQTDGMIYVNANSADVKIALISLT